MTREPAIDIPDRDSTSDTLEVEPECVVSGINIDVAITHPYRGELALTIENPMHRAVKLKETDFDSGDDLMVNYPLTTEPIESFELILEEPATGEWTLTVEDAGASDSGTLDAWTLNIDCLAM